MPVVAAVRTAVVPARLNRADHTRAHEACHAVALLWNAAVDWVHAEWKAGRNPAKHDIRRFVTALPAEERPMHAHTAQWVAFGLHAAIETSRENRRNGMNGVKAPWRVKKYRPLTFTPNFGWRLTPDGTRLALSLGRGRERILLPVPAVTDIHRQAVTPDRWGEIKLCWDMHNRAWTLNISYDTTTWAVPGLDLDGEDRDPDPDRLTVTVAVDEGVINPMTLATLAPDGGYDTLVINGRRGRAVKQHRNKGVAHLQQMIARCRPGSRRYRKLVTAKRKLQGRTKNRLRDFNHQTSAKAARFINESHARWEAYEGRAAMVENRPARNVVVRLAIGDVRGIEASTVRKRRVSRSTRQQLSQWERGTQERYLAEKTGLVCAYIPEHYTSQSCPACTERTKARGRQYRCRTCKIVLHRDVVGAVNIHTVSVNDGNFTPRGPAIVVRVKYLRATSIWTKAQSARHAALTTAKRGSGRPAGKPVVAPRTGPRPGPPEQV